MTGIRGDQGKNVETLNLKGSDFEVKIEATYKWMIQSVTTGTDPKAGEYLKYGDKIYLMNMNNSDKWLSGGRGAGNEGVITHHHSGTYEGVTADSSYQWIVRSNIGNGYRDTRSADPAYGHCVEDFSLVVLQVNNLDNRWLSGSRSAGNEAVITRNILASTYESTFPTVDSYGWIMKRTVGNGSRSERLQCAARGANGHWVPIKYSNQQQTITYTSGVEFTSTQTFERTTSWEGSVTASVSGGFSFGDASLEVSATFGQSYTQIVENALSQFDAQEFTSSFGAGQVWQFQYEITDICDSEFNIVTADLVVTPGATEPPCCLPGYALGREHGPCAQGSPCSCSPEVCNADPEDPNIFCGGGARRNLRG